MIVHKLGYTEETIETSIKDCLKEKRENYEKIAQVKLKRMENDMDKLNEDLDNANREPSYDKKQSQM